MPSARVQYAVKEFPLSDISTTVVRTTVQRFLLLDALRIFAAGWVVLFHWSRGNWFEGAPGWLAAFADAGFLGVDVFFMLSGAVIAYTAMNKTWRQFSASRFLRIFPAYFAVTVIAAVFLIPAGKLDPTPTGWLALTGLHFFVGEPSFVGVAWTLLYELQFYVLVAVLILATRNRLTEASLRGGATIFLLVALLASILGSRELSVVTLSGFGGMFALGALLGISRTRTQLQANLPAIVMAGVLTYATLADRTSAMELSTGATVGWSLGVLLIVAVIILVSAMRSFEPPAALRGPITTLAMMTYPIYLIHAEIALGFVQVVRDLGASAPLAAALSVVGMIGVAWLSVKYFEPWARRTLRSIFGWSTGDAKVTIEPGLPSVDVVAAETPAKAVKVPAIAAVRGFARPTKQRR